MKSMPVYIGLAAVLMIILFIATRFIAPAPPETLDFAAGAQGGAYELTARSYAEKFTEQKMTLKVITSTGSGDNLRMLRAGKASAAIIQGGVAPEEDKAGLLSLGAIFYEPLWVFYRVDRLSDLQLTDDIRNIGNLRIAAGSETSGTRTLVNEILGENGIQTNLLSLSGQEGADAIRAGDIDVFMTVTAPRAAFVRDLLADPGIAVLNFERALAYERRTPYLKSVVFPEGGLDLQANLPASPIQLIAPAAEVVVRKDLHPAIQSLLIEAMADIHRGGTLLSETGAFPTPERADLKLSEEAERYYERGPSFLRRYFPFAVANFLERAWVLAIPLLTLAFPLVKAAPPVIRWRTRRKIYIWYKDLRALEERGRSAKSSQEHKMVMQELGLLQAEVGRVEVPESYTDELYRLRSHILFVSQLLKQLEEGGSADRNDMMVSLAGA